MPVSTDPGVWIREELVRSSVTEVVIPGSRVIHGMQTLQDLGHFSIYSGCLHNSESDPYLIIFSQCSRSRSKQFKGSGNKENRCGIVDP